MCVRVGRRERFHDVAGALGRLYFGPPGLVTNDRGTFAFCLSGVTASLRAFAKFLG